MNTQYMTKLEEWIEAFDRGVPVTTENIQATEGQYSVTFPLAYREYLEVSGGYFPASKLAHRYEYTDEKQTRAKQLLKEYQLEKLIKKDFWVVADFDDAFFYIHLDEGDNPPVYRLDCENYGDMRDEYTFGKIAETFEDWINKKIEFWEEDQQYPE